MSTHTDNGKHARRNMFGEVVLPSVAYMHFKEARASGFFHPKYTWKQCCAAYRKKRHKARVAKMSRRVNRQRAK